PQGPWRGIGETDQLKVHSAIALPSESAAFAGAPFFRAFAKSETFGVRLALSSAKGASTPLCLSNFKPTLPLARSSRPQPSRSLQKACLRRGEACLARPTDLCKERY